MPHTSDDGPVASYVLLVTPVAFAEGGDVMELRFHCWAEAHREYHEARATGRAADLYAVAADGRLTLVSPSGEGVRVLPPAHEPPPSGRLPRRLGPPRSGRADLPARGL